MRDTVCITFFIVLYAKNNAEAILARTQISTAKVRFFCAAEGCLNNRFRRKPAGRATGRNSVPIKPEISPEENSGENKYPLKVQQKVKSEE